MDSRRPAIIDTWLLALANFAIFQGLILFELDRLASDSIWQLGYLTASVFCFAFWLALGTVKWWHRLGQTLLATSTPFILLWSGEMSPSFPWLVLAVIGVHAYAALRLLRVRIAHRDAIDNGHWQWSIKDMLLAMVAVGVIYKLWQAESVPAKQPPIWNWGWDEIAAICILASHGGLMILPILWLLLRPHRLSIWRCFLAGVLTILIAAIDCWLVGPLLSGIWQWPDWIELYDFWLRHVWQAQLAIVLVALANALTWRLLGWRLVIVPRRAKSAATPA